LKQNFRRADIIVKPGAAMIATDARMGEPGEAK
jgi:hypothetical protein